MKFKNILVALIILLAIGGWMFSKNIVNIPFVKNIFTQSSKSPASKSPASKSPASKSPASKSPVSENSIDPVVIQEVYAEVDQRIKTLPSDAEIREENGVQLTKQQLQQKMVVEELKKRGYDDQAIDAHQQAPPQDTDITNADTPENTGQPNNFTPKKKAIAMETTISIAEEYNQKITLPATINSKGYLSINSRITSATVKKILVKNGQRVQKGQLLIELSSDFVPEQLQDHEEKYQITISKFNADKQLYDKNLISEYNFKQSQNAMTSAKVRMLATQKIYDHHFIRAPFSGVVDMIFVNTFDQVGANSKLLDLNDQKSYTITTSLPINTLQYITLGTQFIATDSSDTRIQGNISGISSNANSKTSTYAAEGTITTQGTFNIGEPIFIEVLTQTVPAHEIPLSQVLLDDDGDMAIKVVENNIIVLKPITILWEDLSIAKVTGLGEKAEIFTLGAGFAEVDTPYPPVSENADNTNAPTEPVASKN